MIEGARRRSPTYQLAILAAWVVGCSPVEKASGVDRLNDIGNTCQAADDCGTGLICNAGTCRVDNGAGCYGGSDCASGYCVDGVCVGRGSTPTGGSCNRSEDCLVDHTCEMGICKRIDGQACADPAQCASGYCVGYVCTDHGDASTGEACTVNEDCLATHTCVSSLCKLNDGESCFGFAGSDCVSGICFGDVCCASACDGQCDGTCNSSGACQPAVDGTTCDDGDACTVDDACGDGVCQGDADVVCIGASLLVDITSSSGLEGLYDATKTSWGQSYSISWGDYDNDGDQDVFLGGDGPDNASSGDPEWVGQLYTNNGDSTFTYFGPSVQGDRAGYWADPDNDGDLDLFTSAGISVDGTTVNSCRLHVNDGAATPAFTQEEASIGLGGAVNLGTAAWLDVNADGWIDLFFPNGGTGAGDPPNEIRVNQGGSTLSFTTYTDAGLQTGESNGEMNSVGDIDNDGDIDIWYNDADSAQPDGSLYLNDGAGVFSEGANAAGLAIDMTEDPAPDVEQPYYTVNMIDYNNDGWLDMFFGHPQTRNNRLYTNITAQSSGVLTFQLEATAAFLNVDDGHTRGAAWGDFDHDGDLDVLMGNEENNPASTSNGKRGRSNTFYLNNGASGFTEVSAIFGLDAETRRTFSVSLADFDNDGDLDIVWVNNRSANTVFRNDLNDNKFLKVKVVGKGAGGASKDGIGTRVELRNSDGTTLLAIREVSGGEGYGSQPPLIVHFGLAAAWGGGRGTYTLVARFVSGSVETRSGVVPVDEALTIGVTSLAQTIEIVQQ